MCAKHMQRSYNYLLSNYSHYAAKTMFTCTHVQPVTVGIVLMGDVPLVSFHFRDISKNTSEFKEFNSPGIHLNVDQYQSLK